MTVLDYHDGTKHHFERFARALGYLDWASQPNPFRTFGGAPAFPLSPRPDAGRGASLPGDVLRHALALSAWKRHGGSRWSLRVNPSSGNLHPTEAYVVCGPLEGLASTGGVYHYAPDRHVLEQRCAFDARAWLGTSEQFLVVLTSIHWREAWKYGERAFRYCQHDIGHAIAAVRFAASLHGLGARLLPEWSHRDVAALTGIDRDSDFVEAEREEPACVLAVGPDGPFKAAGLLDAVRGGRWTGRASQLSEDHVQWTFIDDVARLTEDRGRADVAALTTASAAPDDESRNQYARTVIVRRRSALSFDGSSSIAADRWLAMLRRVMPSSGVPPFDAVWWDARVHLALFVHRVDGIAPGLYLLVRNERALEPLRRALTRAFAWTRASDALPLYLLALGDCRRLAARLSCDQDIAADGFFSLGMLAEFETSLAEFGPSFYRHLFWEAGIVGQTLYLEAEAAGARATGIGCFYDDPVHDALGIADHAFQSLYHFAVGVPIEDTRLVTEPPYPWDAESR